VSPGNRSAKQALQYLVLVKETLGEAWLSPRLFRFGAYPDVVVEFDRYPTSLVFWRGTCYIPMLVNENGQWYSNEFNETWNKSGGQGCQEPMSDKESYTNHVRIIENTDARAVVPPRDPGALLVHDRAVRAPAGRSTGPPASAPSTASRRSGSTTRGPSGP